MVHNQDDARDLTHDCALKFLQQIADGAQPRKSEAMLRVMARNMAIDYYRARVKNILPMETEIKPGSVTEAEARVAPWLRSVITELPAKYRDPLTLADLDGLPQKQVADILGLTLSGTKSRIQRARRLLADKVRKFCELDFDGEGRLMACIPRESEFPECQKPKKKKAKRARELCCD